LIGANGQLGSELRQVFCDRDLVPLTHANLELTDQGHVWETLRHYRPKLILNTAAYHPHLALERFDVSLRVLDRGEPLGNHR
jgi:dTDP-4-dehydrorhamnose reductase